MSKNNKKGGLKRSFSEILTCEYDIPGELVAGGCYVEIRGRNCVRVRGCRKIMVYSPTKVVLKMKRDILCVGGKRLSCLTYFAGAISVEGIIDSVSFLRQCEGGGGEE